MIISKIFDDVPCYPTSASHIPKNIFLMSNEALKLMSTAALIAKMMASVDLLRKKK